MGSSFEKKGQRKIFKFKLPFIVSNSIYNMLPIPFLLIAIIAWSIFDLQQPYNKEYPLGAAIVWIFFYLPASFFLFLFSILSTFAFRKRSSTLLGLFYSVVLYAIQYFILFSYPILLSPTVRSIVL